MALKDDGQVSDSACFASGWYDDIFEKVIKTICEARYIVPKNVNTIRYLHLLFKFYFLKFWMASILQIGTTALNFVFKDFTS